MPRKTRKTLIGWKHRWEPQPVVEGKAIDGTDLSRGSRVAIGRNNDEFGTVLGLSDNGRFVGVKFDDTEHVTEYTIEQFVTRFGKAE
jgi:hypothetical protein